MFFYINSQYLIPHNTLLPFSDHNGVLVDLENVTNKIRTEVSFFSWNSNLKNIIPKNKFDETGLTLALHDWQALCISIKYVIAKKPFRKSYQYCRYKHHLTFKNNY